MVTKKIFTIFVFLLFFVGKAKSQYDFIARQLTNGGEVKITKKNWLIKNSSQNGIYYSKLSSREFPLSYVYDGSCGKFSIRGSVFELDKYFENMVACDLDFKSPETYKFYKFSFDNKKYIALQCINNGSGSSTSIIFIHLFQINIDSIVYYPLWSRYGSIACLGDFNRDGVLDFLKIRGNELQTGKDTFNANLLSLDNKGIKFIDAPQSKKWCFKKYYTKDNEIKIKILKAVN